jgi:enamine deaminase RidA (YjgF/YER057c/UK114 family)
MGEQGVTDSPVAQTVFVSDAAAVEESRSVIEAFYGERIPAVTYVPQTPCQDALVAIEAFGLDHRRTPVEIDRRDGRLTVVRHDGMAWCHCGHVGSGSMNGSVHARALDAFEEMNSRLEGAGFRFAQVVRTWLYLGDIVGPDGDRQRYQELNRARADFFEDVPFRDGPVRTSRACREFFPASTGIGANGRDVVMSCIALFSERDDLSITPLENPNQTSAFHYDAVYSPESPRFSRATAVVGEESATLFVSGTASITHSESCHPGDVERQTHQTLDNIAALIGKSNCRSHGLEEFGATLSDLAHMRVYLKNRSDFARVQAICRARVGNLPTIYTVADVCREELLVEIEGVAFSRRA